MAATVVVNKRTVVHKKSAGLVTNFPDVCKTPTPGGPVPIPYPNVARSAKTGKGTKTVKCDGKPICVKGSNFKSSTGDEPGTLGGIVSSTFRNKAEFINYSFNVKAMGKAVCRQLDMMVQNKKSMPNTVPIPEIQPPAVVVVTGDGKLEENTIVSIEII